MKKVLIPTKLESVAKETLKAKGFTVVQDADTSIDKLAAANPDTEAVIFGHLTMQLPAIPAVNISKHSDRILRIAGPEHQHLGIRNGPDQL